jgi:hypothetical protein
MVSFAWSAVTVQKSRADLRAQEDRKREIPVGKSTQREQEERARFKFARTPSTYPGLEFVII